MVANGAVFNSETWTVQQSFGVDKVFADDRASTVYSVCLSKVS